MHLVQENVTHMQTSIAQLESKQLHTDHALQVFILQTHVHKLSHMVIIIFVFLFCYIYEGGGVSNGWANYWDILNFSATVLARDHFLDPQKVLACSVQLGGYP